MRSALSLAACVTLLAATACSSHHVSQTPAPAQKTASRAPAKKNAPAPEASTAARLGVPPGHLPRPGQCRVWVPGTPPGHQAKARSCSGIERTASAGSWILYRPGEDKKLVQVREVDAHQAGVVVNVRVYDVESGALVGEEREGRRVRRR